MFVIRRVLLIWRVILEIVRFKNGRVYFGSETFKGSERQISPVGYLLSTILA